jgi:hypothetical protein
VQPNDIVLAKEYLILSELGNYRAGHDIFLPTYGPRYVDLYSRPNNLRVKKTNVDNIELEVFLFS